MGVLNHKSRNCSPKRRLLTNYSRCIRKRSLHRLRIVPGCVFECRVAGRPPGEKGVPMPTVSQWTTTAEMPRFSPLHKNLSVDVAVIGGGNTGVTAAYLFKKAGLSVALIERERCAAVDTAH